MNASTTNVVCSFTDVEGNEMMVTGKDAHLVNMEMNNSLNEPVELILKFLINPFSKLGNSNVIWESFQNGFKPDRKISKTRVEDCSIEELLFAARQKLKDDNVTKGL